jgi:hypothetical protein
MQTIVLLKWRYKKLCTWDILFFPKVLTELILHETGFSGVLKPLCNFLERKINIWFLYIFIILNILPYSMGCRVCHCHDHIVVWISHSRWGVLDSTLHVCDKVISDSRQVVISLGTPVFSTIKSDCHNITEILLKVVLNTIILTLTPLPLFKGTVVISWWPVWLPSVVLTTPLVMSTECIRRCTCKSNYNTIQIENLNMGIDDHSPFCLSCLGPHRYRWP